MPAIRSSLLLFVLALLACDSDAVEEQNYATENLVAFSQLYGYVRFFHPSTAAAGFHEVHCHFRTYAKAFYHKLGFAVEGDSFLEVGISHHRMAYDLRKGDPTATLAVPAPRSLRQEP